MLSRNQQKLIRSLELKKYRDKSGLFVAQGNKLVEELLDYTSCSLLAATPEWIDRNREKCKKYGVIPCEETIEGLRKVGFMKSPQEVLAVFEKPNTLLTERTLKGSISLALDGVQNPGNLGTIIRLADWFGIEHVLCSQNTADIFSPKSVQSTMGSITRVQCHYVNLPEFLKSIEIPCFGSFMKGDSIYDLEPISEGIIILGNEGEGISKEVEKMVHKRITIPQFPENNRKTESLNVAMAASIICSEVTRKMRK